MVLHHRANGAGLRLEHTGAELTRHPDCDAPGVRPRQIDQGRQSSPLKTIDRYEAWERKTSLTNWPPGLDIVSKRQRDTRHPRALTVVPAKRAVTPPEASAAVVRSLRAAPG